MIHWCRSSWKLNGEQPRSCKLSRIWLINEVFVIDLIVLNEVSANIETLYGKVNVIFCLIVLRLKLKHDLWPMKPNDDRLVYQLTAHNNLHIHMLILFTDNTTLTN